MVRIFRRMFFSGSLLNIVGWKTRAFPLIKCLRTRSGRKPSSGATARLRSATKFSWIMQSGKRVGFSTATDLDAFESSGSCKRVVA